MVSNSWGLNIKIIEIYNGGEIFSYRSTIIKYSNKVLLVEESVK